LTLFLFFFDHDFLFNQTEARRPIPSSLLFETSRLAFFFCVDGPATFLFFISLEGTILARVLAFSFSPSKYVHKPTVSPIPSAFGFRLFFSRTTLCRKYSFPFFSRVSGQRGWISVFSRHPGRFRFSRTFIPLFFFPPGHSGVNWSLRVPGKESLPTFQNYLSFNLLPPFSKKCASITIYNAFSDRQVL